MIFEWDDFGCDHIISDMCQSHDCRDQLYRLKELNPKFKCTLFAIPGEMTPELLKWCSANDSWVELAVHGFYHTSNYECEKMTYDEFYDSVMDFSGNYDSGILSKFKKIFRAPGWQISTDAMLWLHDNDWVLADQAYNNARRPIGLRTYLYDDSSKVFSIDGSPVLAYHGHTWNVGWNGIYEDYDKVSDLVRNCEEFKFLSEVMYGE